ncbi:MAG: phosphotransferase [bacterium]|nr:phosphotransferase [bacterium]
MELTNLIATGKSSKVYRCGDQAVKVFNADVPKVDVLLEALNTARVEETGLSLPGITQVTMIEGQWAIVMNYVEGETLASLMEKDPENMDKYINQMVDIQLKIQTKKSPLLNKLKDKLKNQILSLSEINDIVKYELLTRLDGMPTHDKVCHGDFEPRNIIIAGDNAYPLDWIHATQGNASADVARTYLLLALHNIDTANKYMDTFCEKTNTKKRYVQEWLPIVAAAQLTKNKPEEKELLTRWINVVEYE